MCVCVDNREISERETNDRYPGIVPRPESGSLVFRPNCAHGPMSRCDIYGARPRYSYVYCGVIYLTYDAVKVKH